MTPVAPRTSIASASKNPTAAGRNVIELNVYTWLLAFLPIGVLLATLLVLRWQAPRAAVAALAVAVVVAYGLFHAGPTVLAVAIAKGLSFSLFVLLIVWAAIFLYNLVDQLGAVNVIASSMLAAAQDPVLRVLLMSWCFVGLLQGIAGVGAPVAAVAPLMLLMGLEAVPSAASAMIGHSWAITFGSMGSSYYAIQLVTGLHGQVIGPWMAVMFYLPILATGFSVVHLHYGWEGAWRATPAVLVVGTAMTLGMWLLAAAGAGQIASMLPALLGCGLILLLGRSALYRGGSRERGGPDGGARPGPVATGDLSFNLAFLPYYLLIGLTVLSQLPPVAALAKQLYFGLDYPATTTGLGYAVAAEHAYARIGLLNHPAPLIAYATFISFLVYRHLGRWRKGTATLALSKTYKRSIRSSAAIVCMVMMALIVNDSGMARLLAQGIQSTTNGFFPLLAPYVGVLGAFITGSNTNSNVMFGPLQAQTALVMGISVVLISAVQSVGGSLGAGISPDKSVIGAAVVGIVGREHEILRRALPYTLLAVLLVGVEAWVLIYVFPGLLPGN